MAEAEIAAVCGPKGQHNRRRAAVRHGTGKGSVTSAVAGCRWIGRRHARSTVTRRRSPGTCDFAADDVLTQVVTERMLAGVAMRRHAGTPSRLAPRSRRRRNRLAASVAYWKSSYGVIW